MGKPAFISIIAATAVLAGVLPAMGAGAASRAHAARTLNATDTARLHYVHSSGSKLFEEGSATGAIPGTMSAHFDIGPTVSTTFVLHARGGGTLIGHGSGTLHGSGRYESFAGTLVVNSGTGRYAHAHGHAGLYGTFDRRTYALVVQTSGHLSY